MGNEFSPDEKDPSKLTATDSSGIGQLLTGILCIILGIVSLVIK